MIEIILRCGSSREACSPPSAAFSRQPSHQGLQQPFPSHCQTDPGFYQLSIRAIYVHIRYRWPAGTDLPPRPARVLRIRPADCASARRLPELAGGWTGEQLRHYKAATDSLFIHSHSSINFQLSSYLQFSCGQPSRRQQYLPFPDLPSHACPPSPKMGKQLRAPVHAGSSFTSCKDAIKVG